MSMNRIGHIPITIGVCLLLTLLADTVGAAMIKFTSGKTENCKIVKRGQDRLLLLTPQGHKIIPYDDIRSIQKGLDEQSSVIGPIIADFKRYKRAQRKAGTSPEAIRRQKKKQLAENKRRRRGRFTGRYGEDARKHMRYQRQNRKYEDAKKNGKLY